MSETGERGPRGDHGQHGDQGARGALGLQGERGETGGTGERGPRGDIGNVGPVGATGASTALSRHITGSFVAVVLLFVVTLGTFSYFIRHNNHLAAQGNQAHDALCIFKADLIRRADDGQKFLAEHPNGIPGIKVGVIRESLVNQRKTIKSLDELKCP